MQNITPLLIMVMLMVFPGIASALVENGSGGNCHIQVTHTMDDRTGECSEEEVTFFGVVKCDDEPIPFTPVVVEISGPLNYTLYGNTGSDGHYGITQPLDACCIPGTFLVTGSAPQVDVSDQTELIINTPPESS